MVDYTESSKVVKPKLKRLEALLNELKAHETELK
jgi:hypothetical protein